MLITQNPFEFSAVCRIILSEMSIGLAFWKCAPLPPVTAEGNQDDSSQNLAEKNASKLACGCSGPDRTGGTLPSLRAAVGFEMF